MIWQYLLPQHGLSRLVGWLAHCRIFWIKHTFILWFIRRYQVDMSLAVETNPSKYPHFNAFFTRALKPDVRPIAVGEHNIVSPADGTISQIGTIEAGRIFQAKGFHFNVQELLGGNKELAAIFQQGSFSTIYLAPKDYHRVHMPLDGRLEKMAYIPGQLFSVNKPTTEHIPRLFARNERVVVLFKTAVGHMAMVLVGAMIVASIETTWAGLVAPAKDLRIAWKEYPNNLISLRKGDEMGRFQLGSTVILLFSTPVQWGDAIQSNSALRMGQSLGMSK